MNMSAIGHTVSQILADYNKRWDNTSVYEIEFEGSIAGFFDGSPMTSQPSGWRYVGNADDARYGQLIGQPGYIQVASARGDLIAQSIAQLLA
jgi:hypothetical protein